MKIGCGAMACLVLLLSWPAAGRAETTVNPYETDGYCMNGQTLGRPGKVVVEMDRRARMRDGVILSVDVYRVADGERRPTALSLTPYGNLEYNAANFCEGLRHGYNMALAHVRGTSVSGGVLVPTEGDGRDGYDIIAWLRQQEWSDGRVVMWGLSYMGGDQWQTAALLPPGLIAIAPDVAVQPANWFHPPIPDDQRWLMGYSTEENGTLYHDHTYWGLKAIDALKSRKSMLETLDDYGLNENMKSNVHRWLDPEKVDAQRRALAISANQYRAMAASGLQVLVLAGYFDSVHSDDMQYYDDWRRANPGAEARNLKLWIGPWQHWLGDEFGGLKFGSDANLSWAQKWVNQLGWFDHILFGKPLPEALCAPVNYYQMGLGQGWRQAASLDTMTRTRQRLYLRAAPGEGKTIYKAGALDSQGADYPDLIVRNDPLTVGYVQTAQLRRDFSNDSEYVTAPEAFSETDKLVFVSAPLPGDANIAGRPGIHLYAQMDVPDTSLVATLDVIEPDGRIVYIGHAWMEARYGKDPMKAELVRPGEVRDYRFDFPHNDYGPFSYTARREPPGSRILLTIAAPTKLSDGVNYNTGGLVGAEDGSKARIATIKVLQSGRYRSFIELPLGD